MYFPIQLRLMLFYAFLLVITLWIFGTIVYAQAQQRAYNDLDNTLSSRAASIRLGKTSWVTKTLPICPFHCPVSMGLVQVASLLKYWTTNYTCSQLPQATRQILLKQELVGL